MQQHSWYNAGQTIRQLAAGLMDMQLPPGSCMAIIGKNSPH